MEAPAAHALAQLLGRFHRLEYLVVGERHGGAAAQAHGDGQLRVVVVLPAPLLVRLGAEAYTRPLIGST